MPPGRQSSTTHLVRSHQLGTMPHSKSHTHTALLAQDQVGTAGSLAAHLDLSPPQAPPGSPLLTSPGRVLSPSMPQPPLPVARAPVPPLPQGPTCPRAPPAGRSSHTRRVRRGRADSAGRLGSDPVTAPPLSGQAGRHPLGDAAERCGGGISASATSAARGGTGGDRPTLKFCKVCLVPVWLLSLLTAKPCPEPVPSLPRDLLRAPR